MKKYAMLGLILGLNITGIILNKPEVNKVSNIVIECLMARKK